MHRLLHRAVHAVALPALGCAMLSPLGSARADTAPQAARPLPAGEGRGILERDCTGCHDLDGLWAYKGYYDEERWRAMIDTMIDHGAELDEPEVAALASYLVEHFGPDSG